MIKKEISPDKPGKTAEKIIKAARAVFAESGYSGTTVDEIARRAGVNKATLYYQIGDKDTLYANVIHQVLGNIAQKIAEAVTKSKGPEDRLRVYIHCLVAAVDQNPELPSIMMREVAADGAHLPRVVIEDIASVLIILVEILEEGRKKGVFIEVVPFLIHTMIMGMILLYKKTSPIKDRQTWLPASILALDRKLKGNLEEEVAKLVLRAIRK
ncbi:MAG: TetR/AcrR family transcriptional regulator [Smithellaceae bacterium]